MRRSRPSLTILLISLICGLLSVLPLVGINLVSVPVSSFGLMSVAWLSLLAGVLVPRL